MPKLIITATKDGIGSRDLHFEGTEEEALKAHQDLFPECHGKKVEWNEEKKQWVEADNGWNVRAVPLSQIGCEAFFGGHRATCVFNLNNESDEDDYPWDYERKPLSIQPI